MEETRNSSALLESLHQKLQEAKAGLFEIIRDEDLLGWPLTLACMFVYLLTLASSLPTLIEYILITSCGTWLTVSIKTTTCGSTDRSVNWTLSAWLRKRTTCCRRSYTWVSPSATFPVPRKWPMLSKNESKNSVILSRSFTPFAIRDCVNAIGSRYEFERILTNLTTWTTGSTRPWMMMFCIRFGHSESAGRTWTCRSGMSRLCWTCANLLQSASAAVVGLLLQSAPVLVAHCRQQKCDVGVLKIDQVNNNTLLSKLHCQHQAAETGHSVVWVPRLSINLPRTGKEGGSKRVTGSFPSSPMAQSSPISTRRPKQYLCL